MDLRPTRTLIQRHTCQLILAQNGNDLGDASVPLRYARRCMAPSTVYNQLPNEILDKNINILMDKYDTSSATDKRSVD